MKISQAFGAMLAWVLALMCSQLATAQTLVFDQPHAGSGATLQSSYWDPDGSDYDQYVWDGFLFNDATAVNEIHWRGGYPGSAGTSGGNITKFKVSIYASIPAGTQPDLGYLYTGPIVSYTVNGRANETYAGTFGGTALYDYRYTLPHAFQAVANTRYWLQIEAWQPGWPNWGIAVGTGGNGSHFRRFSYIGDAFYQFGSGDAAFSLYSSSAPSVSIAASASPAGAGTVMGAGSYPVGSTASLTATANTGWGFVNWTQGGSVVSTNSTYNFTANANRTLVANFAPSYTITTYASPGYGGTTSGGGTYIDGAPVTLTATPAPHFVFAGWSDGSMDQVHAFNAWADMQLTAWFVPEPGAVAFDFDAGPGARSLPLAWTVDGLTATFSATGSGFSTQVGGLAPGYGVDPGYYLYPNSVFAADLIIDFSASCTDFSIMYSTQELGCDTSATMRVTVYQDGVQVGTNTNTGPATGTWPVNTLTISAPAGFNRAVVHYAARPATCQDWGPIFFADNVIVTRLCDAAAMTSSPSSAGVCPGSSALFTAGVTGTSPMIAWALEDPTLPGTWMTLEDGPLVLAGETWATISGAGTDSLTFDPAPAVVPAGAVLNLVSVVTNDCGGESSPIFTLTMLDSADAACTSCPACAADFDNNGGVDGADLAAFFTQYEAGETCADVDQNGGIDGADLAYFFQTYEAGGC